MKVLISDKLSEAGLAIFKKAKGITVDFQPGLGKDIAKLKAAIKDAHAIAIRSETKITKEILDVAQNLKVIGRAGIGVDNVDVAEASKHGVVVMNTPGGNTITTAEHAISMMCALTRQIPQATASIKAGKWEKSKFMGRELFGKILGVVGCGNIGKIVADRALGLKMKVIAYDPFLTDEMAEKIKVKKVELDELFSQADYITLHVPKNEKTANLINKDAFAKMKKGVFLINCARGGIVHEGDLVDAIEKGQVAGAALDVFDKEPVDPNNPLLKLDAVIATPHLGAATGEAQENVALDVAEQIVDFLLNGTITNSVNVPSVSGEVLRAIAPYLSLAEKIGRLHGQLATASPHEISIAYQGEITGLPLEALTIAVLRGILEPMLEDVSVNQVNAPMIAKERGIRVSQTKLSGDSDFASLMTVCLHFKNSKREIAGTIFGTKHPRVVRVDDYYLEVVPEGKILIILNEDKPGVVGSIGTYLGQNKINISRMQLGLLEKTRQAMAFYNVEGDISDAVLLGLKKIPGILSVSQVLL